MDVNNLKNHALNIRRNIVQMVYAAQSGHPGGSLGAADILTYLYFEEMNINKDNVASKDRDRFILSKGHCSPALYAVLQEAGLMDEDLLKFRQLGSRLQGHPNMNYIDGVDMSTGSLGQGISCAVGMALANKIDKKDNRVYALCGDGESEEGIVWEALMAACHYGLDDLCVIFDQNGLQIDGNVQDVIGPLPLVDKAKAFGANVVECDGNDYASLKEAFDNARNTKGVPTVIVAHTVKGKGVSYMENNYAWHGAAPKEEDFKTAMEDLKEVR
ncbi:MAG: transketolase [Erysipelotrichaceae bacterium]|nr:transketolase [Erysipelotrichaceae bacterium]